MHKAFEALNSLSKTVCADAYSHGLWDDVPTDQERHYCARRVMDEAEEALLACGDREHFREELADVVIMALSSAAYLGINIGEEVRRKMLINHDRPYRHGKEEGSCRNL